jgi:hypothetical protein
MGIPFLARHSVAHYDEFFQQHCLFFFKVSKASDICGTVTSFLIYSPTENSVGIRSGEQLLGQTNNQATAHL